MPHVYITKASAFMPNEPVSNDEMESVLGQVGNRPSRARKIILRSNGIKNRHYVIDKNTHKITHTNAQLAAEAIRHLENKSFSLNDIDCLTSATSIADQLMPGHGVMVHGELGNRPCEVATTSGVCLSGITALKYAWMSVLSGQSQNAVASASETASMVMKAENFEPEIESRLKDLEKHPELAFEKDFLRWMLSDGAGAFLLQPQAPKGKISLKIEWIDIFSYANEKEACMYAGAEKLESGSLQGWKQASNNEQSKQSYFSVKQDVKLLNSDIIHYTVERPLEQLKVTRDINPESIDYFLPHYSSEFFRDRVYEGMKKAGVDIPQERWFTNLTTKGNTGSASIYIMIEELLSSGKLNGGENILCYIPESGRFSTGFMLLKAEKH